MSEKSRHIDYLIARFIAGEASDAEKHELQLWMDGDETNRKYFEGLKFADQQAVSSNRLVKVDVDRAWQKVHFQMRNENVTEIKQTKTRTLVLPVWIRVAAIVVLVSGLAMLLYQQQNRNVSSGFETVALAPANDVQNYTLPDSSAITLNRNSQIACASDFGKKERRIKLKGEAFFSVQPDKKKPFIVETGETFIRVTGTSFNIKGEEADSLVEVVVKTGQVLFFTANNEGVTLNAGEVGIYNKNRQSFTKKPAADPNTTAYASRMFVFYNTPLKEVLRQLGRVYQVEFSIANPELGICPITVSFENDDIGTILEVIAETLNLSIIFEDNSYQVRGEGCTPNKNQL